MANFKYSETADESSKKEFFLQYAILLSKNSKKCPQTIKIAFDDCIKDGL